MKNIFTKISLFILIGLIISSCNTTRRVPSGKLLLMKNDILVNGKLSLDEDVQNLTYQKPNTTLLGYHLRLNLYNLANQNPDSTYKAKFIKNPSKYINEAKWLSKKQVDRLGQSFWYSGIHSFLKRTGEAPVLLDAARSKKSILRMKSFYFNQGFFDVKATYKIDTISVKKAKIKYEIITGSPYIIDSIRTKIQTPALDSIFEKHRNKSLLKPQQYKSADLENERNRITTLYRNNGVFYFQQNYISYNVDTVGTGKKPNVDLIIADRNIREKDSSKTEHFKIYKINKINIYTDANSSKKTTINKDSTSYNNVTLFSTGKLKYRPKAITDAIFITKGSLFSDNRTTLTTKYLNNLKVFNYPSIQYIVDTKDTTSNSLIANVFLSQKKKYSFRPSFDVTHSNIQDFGIAAVAAVSIRNVFNGAETFEVSLRSNLGSSKDLANPDKKFFNISEVGADAKLIFPRMFFPLKTENIIPKNMIPSTTLTVGFDKQRNIGLDKENFTSNFTYNWTPKRNTTARFDLLNVQFVKNINIANYFNVYKSSYTVLNSLAQQYGANASYFDTNGNLIIESGTTGFINDVLSNNSAVVLNSNDYNTMHSIEERRIRLTENDLILASSFSYSKTTKKDIQDNSFHTFRTKLESAGNVLSTLSRLTKQPQNSAGNYTLFDVNFSQYLKSEFEYVKHWDLRGKKVLAMRSFIGLAVPYGNSNNIPFSRSYYAGGSNDNRAWQAYSLGPGHSNAVNDFNEANLKFAFSTELRFNIFNSLNGALFVDTGNIWNVFDNIEDESSIFSGIRSLQDIAVGSGFGFRYDFTFFVVRFDMGFKTFDPSIEDNKKWFRDYNFTHSVLNIGINYPF